MFQMGKVYLLRSLVEAFMESPDGRVPKLKVSRSAWPAERGTSE